MVEVVRSGADRTLGRAINQSIPLVKTDSRVLVCGGQKMTGSDRWALLVQLAA